MPFERFVPPQSPGARPKVTIRPSGLISFDAAAVDEFGLGNATYAILYFDKTRKQIGVQTTKNPKDVGAFKLSRRRRSVSVKAPQFFERYGLSIEEAQRFDSSWDEDADMILINVKSIQRRRGRRPKRT